MVNNELYLNILSAREEKKKFIEDHINNYQIITLKANIPGSNKRLPISYLLVNLFNQIINNKKKYQEYFFDTDDGPTYIYLINKEVPCLKEEMVEIETNHPLGRFVDLDVYYQNTTSISRGTLRKCYLCEQPAFICGRNKNHSIEEIIDFINIETYQYLNSFIKNCIEESMLKELNLDPKYGLVTPTSNGSHQDMNYQIMKDSIDILKEDMPKFFFEGLSFKNDYKSLLNKLRIMGLDTEQLMLFKTKGINTYKGFIFCGGIILTCIGIKVSRNINDSIYDICKKLCQDLTLELKNGNDTFGKKAYQKYGIGGARKEAENGYPIIQYLINKYQDSNNSLDVILRDIIVNCDDTILLKRCGNIEKYQLVKEMFKTNNDTTYLNEYCLNNHLSFGGSADMLILYELVIGFKKIFNI